MILNDINLNHADLTKREQYQPSRTEIFEVTAPTEFPLPKPLTFARYVATTTQLTMFVIAQALNTPCTPAFIRNDSLLLMLFMR
jgi:hypothetical protein